MSGIVGVIPQSVIGEKGTCRSATFLLLINPLTAIGLKEVGSSRG
jgi:hypothetical protein